MKEKLFKWLVPSSTEEQGACARSLPLILAGPCFLLLGISFFLAKGSLALVFLSLIATLGFVLSWLYQYKGTFYSAGLLVFSQLFLVFLEMNEGGLFSSAIASCGFIVSFYLVAAGSQEDKQYLHVLKTEYDEKVSQLEITSATNQSYLEKQLELSQQETKALEKNLRGQEKEMASYKQLMIACKEESEHYFALADLYKKEADQIGKSVVSLERFQNQIEELKKENSSLLKELNRSRVQSFEYQTLAHEALSEKKFIAEKPSHEIREVSEEYNDLLERRKEYKKMYEERLREYKGLSEKMEMFFSSNTSDDTSKVYEELVHRFEDLGRDLQDVRLDILKVEEGILHLKKELNMTCDEGLSPGSYLAVADQECLRLEEENTLLLRLLSQVITKNQKTEEASSENFELFES